MKTLIWKDFRQSVPLVLAMMVFLSLPYIIAGVHFAVFEESWAGGLLAALLSATFAASLIWVLLAPFIGANAFAAERADRSAEFLAYLPISRVVALGSKAVVAGLLLVVPILVLLALNLLNERDPSAMLLTVPCGLVGFGIAWLLSSVLRSPAFAAALAIGITAVFWVSAAYIFGLASYHKIPDWFWFAALPLFAATTVLAGGTIYVRRLNP